MGWVTGTMVAFTQVSRLNAKAAIWAAVSVLPSGLSALVSAWPSWISARQRIGYADRRLWKFGRRIAVRFLIAAGSGIPISGKTGEKTTPRKPEKKSIKTIGCGKKLAEDAVWSEPLSMSKSLVTAKIAGNLTIFGFPAGHLTR